MNFIFPITFALLLSSQSVQALEQRSVHLLADQLSTLTEMRASFTQTLTDTNGEILDESRGWMAWQRPGKFRWEVLQPLEQTILIKDQMYHQFDRDLDQLLIEELSNDIAMLPSLLLDGKVNNIDENYHVSYDSDAGYILLPKASESLFTRIALRFSAEKLIALEIVDDLQQITRFSFEPVEGGVDNSYNLFEITPGENTDIIRQ